MNFVLKFAVVSSVLLVGFANEAVATDVLLKKLKCRRTEDNTGADECRLMIYSDDKLVKIFYKELNDGQDLTLSYKVSFSDSVTIKLFDDDIPAIGDKDDFLGEVEITKSATNGVGTFDLDEAFYEINWSVIIPPPMPNPQPNPPNKQKTPPSKQKMDSMQSTLEKFLSSELAQGNEGKATVEKFKFEGGRIVFDVKIRHRHKTNGFIVYSVNTSVSGKFDPFNPASIKSLKVCAGLPPALGGGDICVTLEQIASLIAL